MYLLLTHTLRGVTCGPRPLAGMGTAGVCLGTLLQNHPLPAPSSREDAAAVSLQYVTYSVRVLLCLP